MSLQPLDPFTQCATAARTQAHEQMDVLRHDDVPPDANAVFGCSAAIIDEGTVNVASCEERTPPVSIESNEENWRAVFLKDPIQARRFRFPVLVHAKRCSVRCPQRTSLLCSVRCLSANVLMRAKQIDPLRTADSTIFSQPRCSVRCLSAFQNRVFPLGTADATIPAPLARPRASQSALETDCN